MADRADRVLSNVGGRVAELRRAAGYTQDALAERLDVNVQYLQRVEAGRENLTVRSLVKLAVCLRVEVASFFEVPAAVRRAGRPRTR